MRSALLVTHVVAGGTALLVAGALLLGRRGWAGSAGAAYLVALLVTCSTAVLLSGAGSSLPSSARIVLVVIALLTAAAAVAGVRGERRRPGAHLRVLHGSVVSLVTAVAVVSAPVTAWVLVAVLGTAAVETAARGRTRAADAAGT